MHLKPDESRMDPTVSEKPNKQLLFPPEKRIQSNLSRWNSKLKANNRWQTGEEC